MKLYYRQYADQGRGLVILHGLFGQHGNWNRHARILAEDFAVYSLDARNHGRSDWRDSMTYREMAEDVIETMDAAGLDKAHLLGHSMGGKIVMQVAMMAPERVDALVAVDIAPVAYDKGPDDVLSALQSVDLGAISSRDDADRALARTLNSKAIRDFLLTNLHRHEGGFRWRMNLAAIGACYPEILGGLDPETSFTGDTLFIRGSRSDYLHPRHEEATLKLFPGARIETVEDAGHWVHSEKPDAFIGLVERFLKNR